MVEGGAWDGGMGSSGRDESQEGGEAEIGSYFLSKWVFDGVEIILRHQIPRDVPLRALDPVVEADFSQRHVARLFPNQRRVNPLQVPDRRCVGRSGGIGAVEGPFEALSSRRHQVGRAGPSQCGRRGPGLEKDQSRQEGLRVLLPSTAR